MLQGLVPEQESCHGRLSRLGINHHNSHRDCQVSTAWELHSTADLQALIWLCGHCNTVVLSEPGSGLTDVYKLHGVQRRTGMQSSIAEENVLMNCWSLI